MTIEERLSRIERITAGMAEERRKDRHAYRALWRGTQQQIKDLACHVDEFAEETRSGMAELRDSVAAANDRITALAAATDRHLRELGEETDRRIRDLTRAVGEVLRPLPPSNSGA